uniref:non-specific serine/threonine protein kinase n=1 Tax=Nelumbo nucifera TaxID=4432 RepID=A0A822XQP4_NELNU|nr:TPA_asm: hypothetical protein HUJ06_022518 [Nelumbo nucifera]
MALSAVFPVFYLAILLYCQCRSPAPVGESASLSILTDKEALTAFKSLIATDPSNSLSSWEQHSSPCNWTGVICSKSRQRVVGLSLGDLGVTGSITPHIGNLSFLRFLYLQNNKLAGTLPDRIGDLSRLQAVNISSNLIEGPIPPNISKCSEHMHLDLMGNQISGGIPPELGTLSKLQILNLNENKLSGTIPPSIGNLSSLTTLNLATNSLGGFIPSDLARLQNLKKLELSINTLTGIVPQHLYNISSLVYFALASNRLWGKIPSDVGNRLPNLLNINFCINNFTGGIPGSLHNLTKIKSIRMSWNLLGGSVPGGLENLRDLEMYNIGFNRIVSSGDSGLSFITSLSNSSHLQFLALDGNLLEGRIPRDIGNLSTTLTKLYLGGNRIYGNLPPSIGRLRGLALLNVSHNLISGEVPNEIGQLDQLQMLGLAGNKLSGQIPDSLGNLSKLNELELFGNEMVGRIPATFGNYHRLLSMDLSNNRLTGSIPKEIFMHSSLSSLLNLSKNFLSGPIPQEVGMLENIVKIDLSRNNMSGSIPDSIGDCKSLEYLLLAKNLFSGHIPATLEKIRGLNTLDLSSNQLSGSIPYDLQKLQVLQDLNLSFNNLEGEVPTDGVTTVVWTIAGSIALCLVLGLFLSILFYRRRNAKTVASAPEILLKVQHQMVSYDELRTATGNFSQENLIGRGSFGSVYRGVLRQGVIVGVKVLDVRTKGALKSFIAECNALRNVRHRNLVKLITCCSSIDSKNMEFQALVYEFMENGSLEDWIRGRRKHEGEGGGLNVVKRLNVAIDVASAMDYLHHDCQPAVLHCDLKPSNVLLDDEMNAKVGDFGLATLMVETSTQQHSTTTTYDLKGSIGYIPPEYGIGVKPSPRGDVYSYGVMLLELFTGKSPTHEFNGDMSLTKWVQSMFLVNTKEVVDPELLLQLKMDGVHHAGQPLSPKIQQALVSILGIGLSCAIDSPELRMNMRDILHKLKSIKDTLIN